MPIKQFKNPFFRQPGPQYIADPGLGGKPFNVRNAPRPAQSNTQKPTTSKIDGAKKSGLMGEDFMQFAGAFGDALGRAMSYQQPMQAQPYAPVLATGVRPEITQAAGERQNQTAAVNAEMQRTAMQERVTQQELAMKQQQMQADESERARAAILQNEQLQMAREEHPIRMQEAKAKADMASLDAALKTATSDQDISNAITNAGLQGTVLGEMLTSNWAQRKVAGETGAFDVNAVAGERAVSQRRNIKKDERRRQRMEGAQLRGAEAGATTAEVTAEYAPAMAEQTLEGTKLTVEQQKAIQPYYERLAKAGVEDKETQVQLLKTQSDIATKNLENINKWQDKLSNEQYTNAVTNNKQADLQLQEIQARVDNATDDRERAIAAQRLDAQYKVMSMQSMAFDAEMAARREGRMEQAQVLGLLGKLSDSAATGNVLDEDTLNGVAAKTFVEQKKATIPGLSNVLKGKTSGTDMDAALRVYLIEHGNNQDVMDYNDAKLALKDYNQSSADSGLHTLPSFISTLMESPEVQSANMPKLPEGVFKDVGLTPPASAAPFDKQTTQQTTVMQQLSQVQTQNAPALPPASYPEGTPTAIGNAENVEIRGQNYAVIGEAMRTGPAPDYTAAGEEDPAFKRFNETIESGTPVLEFTDKGVPKAMHYKTVWGDYVKLDDPYIISQILNSGPGGLSVILSTPHLQSLFPNAKGTSPMAAMAPGAWTQNAPKTSEQIAVEQQAKREADRETIAAQRARRASWGSGSGGRSGYQVLGK